MSRCVVFVWVAGVCVGRLVCCVDVWVLCSCVSVVLCWWIVGL